VFENYQNWQRRLEEQPVYFIDRELPDLLKKARGVLGKYINAPDSDLVYVPNATYGVNIVARSLGLLPGDELLTTDHEYGACVRAWQFMSLKRGFNIIQQPIHLPVGSPEETVEQFWRGVSDKTKIIFISHITSSTAQHFPVEAICARARQEGILTMVDGAHAPGQIPLDLGAVGADFYTGNAHKWLCSPKGAAFLYTRPERQPLVEPLIVGWGWGKERAFSYGSDYLDYLQWVGTNDVSAYLAVPAAIQFQEEFDWPTVRERCHRLLNKALDRIQHITELDPVYDSELAYHQMAIAPLPRQNDLRDVKERLLEEYHIEIPLIEWKDAHYIRVSVQGYNNQDDIDALIAALRVLLQT
ncbi:MAG: aminotransferase class V-fold PLP-dependent enzyme, partial [Candidatus Promineifilaceae bacterium]